MLSARQRAALEALAPSGAHPALRSGLLDAGFEAFYARFRGEAGAPLRLAFEAALWSAVWVAPLLIGRLPPITRLSPDAREQALEALLCHRVYWLRQLGLVLKAVACFCYGADPLVRDALGYPIQFDDARRRVPAGRP
ncbi:MAG: hypothetical protein HY554_13745 [Elusimicrobia bacterium]|nr:hypothetical protein [Elusimicrobiota bacterium]